MQVTEAMVEAAQEHARGVEDVWIDKSVLRGALQAALDASPEMAMPMLFATNPAPRSAEEIAQFEQAFADAAGKPPVLFAQRPVSVTDTSTFYIGSDSHDDSADWATVTHAPCCTDVFSGERDPRNPNMDAVLSLMAAHRCPVATGGTLTEPIGLPSEHPLFDTCGFSDVMANAPVNQNVALDFATGEITIFGRDSATGRLRIVDDDA
jgi:hypothetical protein